MAQANHREHQADSTIAVVQVNGKPFVAGLSWRPLRSVRNYSAEAKALGKSEQMGMVAIRKGRAIIQAGFAPKNSRKLKGLPSLAAALAGALGEDWIGVFEVGPDRYALVAVHQGAVLPGRDIVGDRASIATLLRETRSLIATDEDGYAQGLGRVIAPDDFEVGGEQRTLSDVLSGNTIKPEYRLRALTLEITPKEAVAVGMLVGVLAVAGYGVTVWQQSREEARARAEAQARALAEAQAAEAAKAAESTVEQPELVRPWISQPAAKEVLQACAAHWASTPATVGGWKLHRGQCSRGSASADYRRNGGTPLSAFAGSARQQYGNQAVSLSEQGNAGTITMPPVALEAASDEVLQARDVLVETIISHFQRLGTLGTLSLTEQPIPPPPPDEPDRPMPDWTTYAMTVQTRLPLDRVFDGVDLTGIRVSNATATFAPDKGAVSWTINGEVYVR